MAKHTKEPWSINEWPQPDREISIGSIGTPLIAKVLMRDVSAHEHEANASRIVACVNACAGVPNHILERMADESCCVMLSSEHDDLIAQRDDFNEYQAGYEDAPDKLEYSRQMMCKIRERRFK